jgi:hypothetical protein
MCEGADAAPRVSRKEALVPWPRAARVLGRTTDTLDNWFADPAIRMPAVQQPGGKAAYASWLDAVLASARPGVAGDMAEASRQWWAARGHATLEAVA